MTSVRMDKWLWAARFFRTRALAAKACELGRIQSNGQPAKAAREVKVGDLLRVTNDGGDFQVEVLLLSEIRGPASVAQTLYRDRGEQGTAPQSGSRTQSHEAVRRVTRRQTIKARPPQNYPVPGKSLTSGKSGPMLGALTIRWPRRRPGEELPNESRSAHFDR